MEALLQSVRILQDHLARVGIRSVVIGGVAVAVWGEPRVTRDVDVKISLGRDGAERLLDALASGYATLVEDPRQVLRRHGMLFVRDMLGTRLDLLLADTPYDLLAVERGREVEVQPGVVLRMCSAEDLIIYKLISTRPRDQADVEGIVRRQGATLDAGYIQDWLRQFEQALDDGTLIDRFKQMRAALGTAG